MRKRSIFAIAALAASLSSFADETHEPAQSTV